MVNTRSTKVDREKRAYGNNTLWDIFKKLKEIPNLGDEELREDANGNRIHFNDYGDKTQITGWQVDHIKPKIKFPELEHTLSNLRALSCLANVQKGDKFDHLDKNNHDDMLECNETTFKSRYRKTKIEEGNLYHVYLTPRVKEQHLCKVIRIDKRKILVESNGVEHWVYHDRILFEYTK